MFSCTMINLYSKLHLYDFVFLAITKPKKPVDQFVFTKIEKTGSSTFFTVLARYVIRHKLNILMQKRRVHIDWNVKKGIGESENIYFIHFF